MHKLVPDNRWRMLVKAVTEKVMPEDLFLQRVYRVVLGEMTDENISSALDIINTPFERDCLVAYFLSGATHEYICGAIGLNSDICRNFEHLYIDMSTFRYRLEVLRYADYYMQNVAIGDHVELIRQAMHQGPEYVTYRIKPEANDILNIEKISARMLVQSFYTAGIAKTLNADSPLSRQALKWMAMASKVLAAVKEQAPQDPEELHISILAMPQAKSLEAMDISADDLIH